MNNVMAHKFVQVLGKAAIAVVSIILMLSSIVRAEESKAKIVGPELVIREKLVAQYPSTRFGEVKATPLAGVYEVVMGNNVAYVGDDTRYMLFGNLLDVTTNTDLTAATKERLGRVAFNELDFSKAITFEPVSGKVEYEVAVFSDPACSYCKTLEKTLGEISHLRYHIFLTPMQADSMVQSVAVWCAVDQKRQWKAAMTQGRQQARSDMNLRPNCDASAVDYSAGLAHSLNVQGTPTLIARNGARQAGALSRDDLMNWLSANQSIAPATSTAPTLKTKAQP